MHINENSNVNSHVRKATDSQHDAQPKWIVPTPVGVLLVGPEGVGKVYTACCLEYWLFGSFVNDFRIANDKTHVNKINENSEKDTVECTKSESECMAENHSINSDDFELDGVLELMVEDYIVPANNGNYGNDAHLRQQLIVNYIYFHQGYGAVVILHQIEYLPKLVLSSIA